MNTTRSDKLNSEFKKLIYEILTTKAKDVRLTEMFSIVRVETDKELSTAKVYVSIYSTDKEKSSKTFEAMCDAAGFVRSQLFKCMKIRTIPRIVFYMDESMSYSAHISNILNEILPQKRAADVDDAERTDDE